MAKFYLNEFRSKTPSASGSPQGAEVPLGPYKRSGEPAKVTPAKYFGVDARVQNIDIQKNIPSLMQGKLPENLSNALVGGQLAASNKWAGAVGSLANLAETTGNLAAKMQYANEVASKSTAKNLIAANYEAYREEVANNNLKPTQAYDLLVNKYQPQLDEDLGSLKLSRNVLDEIVPEANLKKSQQRTAVRTAMNEEQRDNRLTQYKTRHTRAINDGDIAEANEVVHDKYASGDISLAQRDAELEENKALYDEWKVRRDITESGSVPRVTLAHLDEAIGQGKSEWYPNLNLRQLQEWRHNAKIEIDRREQDKVEQIGNGIADGTIKNPGDVEKLAEGDVDALKIQKINDYFTDPKPVEYSQEAMAIVEAAIITYEKEAPGSGSPNFYAIHDMIRLTTPKAEHEDLYKRLKAKRDEDTDALPGKDWFNSVHESVENMRKDGSFAGIKPPMYLFGAGFGGGQEKIDMTMVNKGDTDPAARKYRLEHRSEIEEMNKKARSIQIELQRWRKAHPGNDKATQDEADKYRNNLLESTSAEAGLVPIQQKTRPQAPAGVIGRPTSSTGGTLNESLISTVKQLEGFNPSAYWDSGQYSIGYGTRGRKGEQLSEAEADARLAQELTMHASNVDRAAQQVGLDLTEGQRNALISFDFNTGAADRLIVSSGGNIDEIRRRLPSWNKEEKGGPVSKGLVNRRRAELAMFNT